MIQSLRNDLWRYRELILQLAVRDLKSRYKVSVLGFFWSLLRPLLTIIVLAAVFSMLDFTSQVYRVSYWVILPVAYIPWFFFSIAFLEGTQSLLANAHLVKKVYSPRPVFPAAVILSNLINFIFSLAVMIPVLYLFTPVRPTWALLQLPAVLLIHALFLLGLCFFTATLNVLYRDTTQICEFLIFVWFYLSPVLYDMNTVQVQLQDPWRRLYELNPMVGLTEWYRFIFLASSRADLEWYRQEVLFRDVPISALLALAVFFLGYRFMKRLEIRAVDEL